MPIRRGQLEIHVELNEIAGPAGRQRLEPQAVSVLELLARETGRVWSREELLDRAWAGRVVSDATLTGVISRLRRALADAGVDDVRIETRSKRGYLLVHAAREGVNRQRRQLHGWLVLASVALLAGIAVAAQWFPRESGQVSLQGVRLDFDITFPNGEMSDAAIWLKEGEDGQVSLSGKYPLHIRVIPALVGDDMLRLRFEASGLAHWVGLEQVIGLGTESSFTLKSDDSSALYAIRFIASRASSPGAKEIPR